MPVFIPRMSEGALFRKRIFAEVTKDLRMIPAWIRVDPKSNGWCPYKKRRDIDAAGTRHMKTKAETGAMWS